MHRNWWMNKDKGLNDPSRYLNKFSQLKKVRDKVSESTAPLLPKRLFYSSIELSINEASVEPERTRSQKFLLFIFYGFWILISWLLFPNHTPSASEVNIDVQTWTFLHFDVTPWIKNPSNYSYAYSR